MTFDRAPAADDPWWPRASGWLAGDEATPDDGLVDAPDDGHVDEPVHERSGEAVGAARVVVVGVPTSVGSISASEAWRTPAAVRAAMARLSTWDPGSERDLRGAVVVEDAGDWDVADLGLDAAMDRVRTGAIGLRPDVDAAVHVFLGGDNAITRPIVAGLWGPDLHDVGVITLDAHHDVRHLDDGPRNGSPVRGLVADGLRGDRVVQVGLGQFTNSGPYARWSARHGLRAITAHDLHERGVDWAIDTALDHLPAVRAIHVDVDMDVLDVAHAPACPGARPGGLDPHQLFTTVRRLVADARVRSVDLVEVDAARDPDGRTVMVTAMTLLHVLAGIADR